MHGHSLKNGGQASNDETKDNNADTMQNNMFSTNGLGTARENNVLCMAAALHNGQRYSRKRETQQHKIHKHNMFRDPSEKEALLKAYVSREIIVCLHYACYF